MYCINLQYTPSVRYYLHTLFWTDTHTWRFRPLYLKSRPLWVFDNPLLWPSVNDLTKKTFLKFFLWNIFQAYPSIANHCDVTMDGVYYNIKSPGYYMELWVLFQATHQKVTSHLQRYPLNLWRIISEIPDIFKVVFHDQPKI